MWLVHSRATYFAERREKKTRERRLTEPRGFGGRHEGIRTSPPRFTKQGLKVEQRNNGSEESEGENHLKTRTERQHASNAAAVSWKVHAIGRGERLISGKNWNSEC